MRPLLVDYPFGGKRFLLHWWTYDDRGHVVIAETERSFVVTARRVFAENPGAEIKAMCEIEVVAPSEKLEKFASECEHREEVSAFHFMMCYRVHDALEEGGFKLSAPFALCKEFEPIEEDESEWAKERHLGCRNCKERIRLISTTPEELHARYAAEWYELHPGERPGRLDSKKTKSRAPRAKDGDELWYARSNFGHHAGGVELHEVDTSFVPGHFREGLMFFFKRLRELDQAEMVLDLTKEKKKWESFRKRGEKDRKEKFLREKRERHEDVVRFFKDRT